VGGLNKLGTSPFRMIRFFLTDGSGIGRNLIDRFLGQLIAANIYGVHLQTTTYNKAALYLYQKMGFQLLFYTPSYLWQYLVNEPVFELTYGMNLKM